MNFPANTDQESPTPNRQDFLTKGESLMSEISALAAANFLNQASLPLIQAATVPQGNPSSSSSTQDTVSLSSEAKTLHAHHK
jgi:hypothetical protein